MNIKTAELQAEYRAITQRSIRNRSQNSITVGPGAHIMSKLFDECAEQLGGVITDADYLPLPKKQTQRESDLQEFIQAERRQVLRCGEAQRGLR